uniref:UBC core domain-containing protein n=2 Tax=Anabas testudineus TaxID=64144 RepID=A0A7N6FEC8_ANATE
MERAVVLQKIKDGEKIPNCTEDVLQETSLKRALDVEKILLSVHPSVTTYHLWISHESVTSQNFHICVEKTFGGIAEELKGFPHLSVTPPLLLKDLGCQDPCLVLLNEGNLGVYLNKNKLMPAMIEVYDCLAGKVQNFDVDELAKITGDHRDDHSFVTTRTPKEAILVLIDASGSMTEKCYGNVEIQKIHAVKELFDNFATRSMAYDFHHIIGLVTFNSTVTTVHTFTETLERFKEHVHTLKAAGRTLLYDGLHYGILELGKVKRKFPDCRLRILCLTDGNDDGSSRRPEAVAVNLIKSNIIVDSILLGRVENNVLHGISMATGGCCFKPETSQDGLKLFEIETVLSLEMRKPKTKTDPAHITKTCLTRFFATHGYDEFPKAVLPSQMNSKVTMTESALKKRIREHKEGRFMEKDKRILEELRSLHCHPHPYFSIFPSESDFTFWKILLEGPPDTPYENGVFELFCQFGPDYPVKPPTVRFVTPIYHCNINSVGRICHNIFDRSYNAQIAMREILDAVYGLLIVPEPEDPLDSILAEQFLTSHDKYEQEAKKHTEKAAGQPLDDVEKKLVEPEEHFVPQHLICPLTKKLFVDPVKTRHGTVYERKAIEKHLKVKGRNDPLAGPNTMLRRTDLTADHDMKKMVTAYRSNQIRETIV